MTNTTSRIQGLSIPKTLRSEDSGNTGRRFVAVGLGFVLCLAAGFSLLQSKAPIAEGADSATRSNKVDTHDHPTQPGC